MNFELRWVERGQPRGDQASYQSVRVLQYREREYEDGMPELGQPGYFTDRWSDWRDVPTEAK